MEDFTSSLTRAQINSREATRDCVFILEELTHWDVDTDNIPNERFAMLNLLLADKGAYHEETRQYYLDLYSLGYAKPNYSYNTAEGAVVFYSREEAEAFTDIRKHYKWPNGYRIYGVPAHGELARAIEYYAKSNFK